MSSRDKTYFKILRQQHPLLYKLCCCILFIYLALNIIKIEVPPFFLFTMYSVPLPHSDTQYIYEFRYNDDEQWAIHEYWNHHKRMTFYYTIDFYYKSVFSELPVQAADGIKFKGWVKNNAWLSRYAEHVYAGPEEFNAYPAWLKKYMERVIGGEIRNYTVFRTQVAFRGSELNVLSRDTVITYPARSL